MVNVCTHIVGTWSASISCARGKYFSCGVPVLFPFSGGLDPSSVRVAPCEGGLTREVVALNCGVDISAEGTM